MTEEEYEQLCEKMQADEGASCEEGDEMTETDKRRREYRSSAEGEYHYAAVEEED